MEGKLITKTGRVFPVNLYNKLEAKLKENKSNEAQPQQQQEPDKSLVKCPKCGRMVNRDKVVKKKYICYECEVISE